MKILVIDDSPLHCEAARKQFAAEHDLTVASSYKDALDLLPPKHEFEVVLCDLLMPPNMWGVRGSFSGEMPVGVFLALLAAKNGARYVAVLTDSDHHSHPASACFDAFNEHEYKPTRFSVEGAQVLLSNTRGWIENDESVVPQEVWRERLDGSRYSDKIYPRIKRWDYLLAYLLNPSIPRPTSRW